MTHPERQEPCPVPGCFDPVSASPLCHTHWGALPIYSKQAIREAEREVDKAQPGPERIEAKVALNGVVEGAVEALGEAA